jgi:hypothetical protein
MVPIRPLVCAALVLVAAPLGAQPMVPELGAYTVLGVQDVGLRRAARVTSGAAGAVGGTARLGRKARVAGALAAPTVRLARDIRTGPLFCHVVSGPAPLPGCAAFTDPLVDPALLQPPAVTAGSIDLVVRPRTGMAPIPPGSFRDVRVGRGAVLQLAGGTYDAQSLRVGARGRLVCVAPCVVNVLQTVRLKPGAELGAEAATRADTVRVNVGAIGGSAFVARPEASVSATVFAPGTGIVLGPRGVYRGAFIGATVLVGAEATVRGDSGL